MTTWMREWLMGIVATALLAAMADCLVAQGAIRRIVRLTGGVLMVMVLLRPLNSLPMKELSVSFDEYQKQIDEMTEQYRYEQDATYSAIIAEKLSAYIVDKAAEIGIETEVQVTTEETEAGVPLPSEVYLTIPEDSEMSDWLETELGIPSEAQYWQEE